ncbi:MAG: hypothetical protein QNL61_06755 [Crocinitomicaceae bacterium]
MKLNNVKFGALVMVASLTLGTVSCKKDGCTDETATNYDSKAKKDDGSCVYEETPVAGTVNKAGNITANETWTADNIYILTGKVVVNSGVTLTIQPGTIIKGAEGTGTLASALVVAQGGKLNAAGTAALPIIFTSVLDNITVGQLTGTNLDENDQGLWGGLIILGYAPISAADGDVLSQIEGIPASDAFGAFGGSNSSDDSGDLAYISIRHGGALIGAGNEINGLTLGGVGSGTSISNIEVVSNLDDGIEFFGGTVNVSNVLIGHQGDDGIDIDMNYSGTITNFVVINGVNSDKSLEVDGPEGTTNTSGLFTLLNGTTNGTGDFKSKAQGTTNNVKIGIAKIRASYQNACADPKADAFVYLTQGSPTLVFTGAEFTSVLVYTASDDGGSPATACSVFAIDQTAAEGSMTSATASGFASAGFASWTWMGVNNKL